MESLRVLIVGGYGTFGGRLVKLLEDEAGLALIVAGRSRNKAARFCEGRAARAELVPAAFDRDGALAAQLAALKPDLVIDASGPFQAYGEGGYRLVETCIAGGISYADLADAREFVAGIARFDAAARAANVFVLSGLSTFPALSTAVLRRLALDFASVESVRGGVAPSPHAGVGENVVRAMAAQAGQKAQGYPFTRQSRYTIAPPGRVPLRRKLFSNVAVPDEHLLPQVWPGLRSVDMGAGPVPEVLHRALIALAWLVRWGVLRSLAPFAPLMNWATRNLVWGEHRGGMFIEMTGSDAGGKAVRSWHLVAEGDIGPFIPSLGAALIVRKMLAGTRPDPGARAATHDLSLAEFERAFAGLGIVTGLRDGTVQPLLYRRVLGTAWTALPEQIRAMHEGELVAWGEATVERGTNPLANLIGAIIGFPRAGTRVPLQVRFAVEGNEEVWTRTFAGKSFSSRQFEGGGRYAHLLCERFGPLNFPMALELVDGKLNLVLRGWTAFGIPMPAFLGPRVVAFENVDDEGRFRFHSDISLPLIGRIVHYRGWLVVHAATA